jgi:hypothetical protein
MTSQDDRVLFFGYPEEGEKFMERHPLWPERFMNLIQAIETAFTREQEPPTMSVPIAPVFYWA